MKLTCPNGALIISDGHSEPDQGMPDAAWLAAMAAEKHNCPLILNGDMLDVIIWGWQSYRSNKSVRLLKGMSDSQLIYYIAGNHDPVHLLRKLFRGSQVHVCKILELDVNGVRWHLEHGDRYSQDWGSIGWLYSAVAFGMLRLAPRLWLRLMKPYRPGPLKPPTGTESEQYNELTGVCWRNAFKDAYRRTAAVSHGHTHTTHVEEVNGLQVIDSGDIRDGSAVYIDPHGRGSIKWFVVNDGRSGT